MVTELDAQAITESVTDPELPPLTLSDLGILRDVEVSPTGRVRVSITPTYSGCPAIAAMRADLLAALSEAGYTDVEIRTVLHPPWSTDWITESGRAKLREHGIAPPGPAPGRSAGPVPLVLQPLRAAIPCPRCGAPDAEEISEFGPTPCTSLWKCPACGEPFEHVKEI